MTKIVGKFQDLHLENFLSGKAVSEAQLKPIAELVQWVKENCGDQLGDVKYSALTEAQFAELKGYVIVDGGNPVPESQKKWVLWKGQSIVGSDYSNLTGKNSIPNLVSNEAHLAQTVNDSQLLSYQENQNKSHAHYVANGDTVSSNSTTTDVSPANSLVFDALNEGGESRNYRFKGTSTVPNRGLTSSSGGAVARPNRVMVNIFIKINN